MKRIAIVLELDDDEMYQIKQYVNEIHRQIRTLEKEIKNEQFCAKDSSISELFTHSIARYTRQLDLLKKTMQLFSHQNRKHQLTIDFTQRYHPDITSNMFELYSFVKNHNIHVLEKIDQVAYFANI
jgi:hypothetical protein